MPISESPRPIETTINGWSSEVLVERFRGTECLSRLFHFRLDLLTPAGAPLDYGSVLGQKIGVKIESQGQPPRWYHGLVSRLTEDGVVAGPSGGQSYIRFQAEMVPHLWLLRKRVQCRVFQDMSVPDILKQLLQGFDHQFRLFDEYPKRNYCVQYRESDFAFLSRLMEDEGVSYFFEHDETGHRFVAIDNSATCVKVPGLPAIPFAVSEHEARADRAQILSWRKTQEVGATRFTVRDYHFELPDSDLQAGHDVPKDVSVGTVTHSLRGTADVDLEIFDYPANPGNCHDSIDHHGNPRAEGLGRVHETNRRTARLRMEEANARNVVIEAASNVPLLSPGLQFDLTGHPRGAGTYLVTANEFETAQPIQHVEETATFHYRNSFQCQPGTLPYRPPLTTPKPVIHGTQSAQVIGVAESDDVFCDKYGRVKVRFRWDRQPAGAGNSCWLRVTQFWAGKKYGGMFLPRVGHEVLVGFMNGDPDQPVILGSLFNAENMPPADLPDARSAEMIRTRSSTGKPNEFSGLVFSDKLNDEQVILRSQNNLSVIAAKDVNIRSANDVHFYVNGQIWEHRGEPFPVPESSGKGGGDSPSWGWEDWDNKDDYKGKDKDKPGLRVDAVGFSAWTKPTLKTSTGINGKLSIGLDFSVGMGAGIKVDVNPLIFIPEILDSVAKPVYTAANLVFGMLPNTIGISMSGGTKLSLGPSYSYSRGTSFKIDGSYPDDPEIQFGLTDKARDVMALLTTTALGAAMVVTMANIKQLAKPASQEDELRKKLVIAADALALAGLGLQVAFELIPGIMARNKLKEIKKKMKKAARNAAAEAPKQVAEHVGYIIEGSSKALDNMLDSYKDSDAVKKSKKQGQSVINISRHANITVARDIMLIGESPLDSLEPCAIVINAEGNSNPLQDNGCLFLRGSSSATLLGGKDGLYIGNGNTTGKIWIDAGYSGEINILQGTTLKGQRGLLISDQGIMLDGNTIKVDVTSKDEITISSPRKITLMVGTNAIELSPGGIKISGLKLEGNFDVRAEIKALQSQISAMATLEQIFALLKAD